MPHGDQRWQLYFFQGRLIYATGTMHRVRRWRRAIKRNCPNLKVTSIKCSEPWEYQLLSHSVTQGQISVAQAQDVIKTSLEEVLFVWVSQLVVNSEWEAVQRFSFQDNTALSLLLSAKEVEAALERSQILWKRWRTYGLEMLNPHKSPVLKSPLETESGDIPASLANLKPFLTGRHTLWDIASYAQRPISTVTRFLLPWIQQGKITLEDLADLPPLFKEPASVKKVASSYQPLIACIDDSPTVCQFLANALEPAGYRVLKIHDPLLGIADITKQKPDLIFMDLIMPNVNGYDLCNFLRKTPIFQNTPIIILTSQNGLVDRTRAKLSGASDFLSKPPDTQVLLQLVQNHLSATAAPASGGGGE